MKYRKKPVIIEAFKLTADPDQTEDLKWMIDAIKSGTVWFGEDCVYIKTLEGTHKASKGDYIIRGIAGELYPCKPDIFEQTYETVQ